jgi:hypothetical protein
MKMSLLIWMAMVSIVMGSNRVAAAAEPAPQESTAAPQDGIGWMADSHGCKAYVAGSPETISWTGTCEGGYISGAGTLTQ